MELNFSSQPNLIVRNKELLIEEKVNTVFNFKCPKILFSFWESYKHILFDNGISIYGFSVAMERNEQYEINDYLNDFILLGDDGSGQGIFIKKGDNNLNLYVLDFSGIFSEQPQFINKQFFEWIENNPNLKEEQQVEEDDSWLDRCDLYVVKEPVNKNKFLFLIRKKLNIDISLSELLKLLDNTPVVIKKDFVPFKYKKEIEILNSEDNCLLVKRR